MVADPLGRMTWIDRDIRATGNDHGEQCGDQIGRAREEQRHPGLRADARLDQQAGQSIDLLSQLTVGQGDVTLNQGRQLRRFGDPTFDELSHRVWQFRSLRPRVPGVHHGAMVNRGRRGDRAKGVGTPIGSGDDQLHDAEVEIREPVCHRVVDCRPVVGQRHRHRLVQRDKRSQPVVRGLDVLDGPESQIADIFGTFEVLDREQGVEQLANTQRRMEIQERNMLVVEHFGLRADEVLDHVVHGVALGPAHPGGHGVQQHPDDPVDAVHIFATTRCGGTEHHIGPTHDAAQQNTPCRGHHGTLADRSRSGVRRQCLPVIGPQRTTAPTETIARTARQVVGDRCRISDVGEVVLPRFHLALWRSPLRPPPQEVAELRCAGV